MICENMSGSTAEFLYFVICNEIGISEHFSSFILPKLKTENVL